MAGLTGLTGLNPRPCARHAGTNELKSTNLFQVGANNLNEVLSGFFRRLGFPIHVIANVVFHKLGHEAVDGSATCRETLKHLSARRVLVKGAEDGFELADDFLTSVDESCPRTQELGAWQRCGKT